MTIRSILLFKNLQVKLESTGRVQVFTRACFRKFGFLFLYIQNVITGAFGQDLLTENFQKDMFITFGVW